MAEIDSSAPWRLSPGEGAELLALLYDAPIAGGRDPCAVSLDGPLRCEQVNLRSWNRLLESRRPALLALVDARRFESAALLVGVEGDVALLASAAGIHRQALAELAPEWTGTAWRFWRMPAPVQRALQLGDQGDDVAAVAALFARLDGQTQALTDSGFDARLEARVRLFQRQQGLRADGVMGENTLRALSAAVGDELDFADAQARITALSRGEAQR